MDAIRYGSFFMFFHLRNVLIYIFLPKEDANFRQGCIIEALRYINSDTILYSDVFFITLLDTIVISSDDEIDVYKSDGNISDENDLRERELNFCWSFASAFYRAYKLWAMTTIKLHFSNSCSSCISLHFFR